MICDWHSFNVVLCPSWPRIILGSETIPWFEFMEGFQEIWTGDTENTLHPVPVSYSSLRLTYIRDHGDVEGSCHPPLMHASLLWANVAINSVCPQGSSLANTGSLLPPRLGHHER